MQKKAGAINVVAKAAQVIKACQSLGGGLSLADIAKHVGLPRSTVQRIVQTLVQEGFLATDGTARSIRLGPELLDMGVSVASNVVEQVQPLLRRIAAETGETVDLSRFAQDRMVFLNQIAGSHRLRAVSAVGDTFPMHCSANGKAVLALLPEEALRQIVVRGLKRYAPNTITQPKVLADHIAAIRSAGFAVDQEEHSVGVCAIGIAVKDKANQCYAVSIPIPTVRFAQSRKLSEKVLLASRDALNKALQK